jgi:hypothetical protein
VRDGAAERSLGSPLRVGVYPLVVASQRGERVDVRLRDDLILAVPEVLADSGPDLVEPGDGAHRYLLRTLDFL